MTRIRTLTVLEEDDGAVRYFDMFRGEEVFLGDVPDPTPDPDPVPDPDPSDPYVFEYVAFMDHGDSYEAVNERMEILEGQTNGNMMDFHFKSLADKMSARDGKFVIAPINMTVDPDLNWEGDIVVTSPRKPDFTPRNGFARWTKARTGEYLLEFVIEGTIMTGDDLTSNDVPWNWHYGFDIKGSIRIV